MSAASAVGQLHLVSRGLAAVALVFLSPILLGAAVFIKLSSRGPLLFSAPRVGLAGRTFTMLKFRTMRQAPIASASRITGSRDSRVFPVGRWLRRLKIDELPQLINVLRGDMVLVGPRPEDPTIMADYYTPFMRETLVVLPGLTSPGSLDYYAREVAMPTTPAEAERVYASVLLPRKIALDLVYVRNRSSWYDLQLVLRTLASMVGAHRVFPKRRSWESIEADMLLDAEAHAQTAALITGAVQR